MGDTCAWDMGEESLECGGSWEHRRDAEDVKRLLSSVRLIMTVAEH